MFFVLLSCAIIAFVIFAKKCCNYWERRGLVAVNTFFNLKTTFQYFLGLRSQGEIFEDLYNGAPNAKYVAFYHLMKPVLLIRDPELVHQICGKDFRYFQHRIPVSTSSCGRLTKNLFLLKGEEWRSVRRKLNAVFSAEHMKNLFPRMEQCAKILVERMRPNIGSTEVVDVSDTTSRFALDIVGQCIFGFPLNSEGKSNIFFKDMMHWVDYSGIKNGIRFVLLILNAKCMKYFGLGLTERGAEKHMFRLSNVSNYRRRTDEHFADAVVPTMFRLKDEELNTSKRIFTDDVIQGNAFSFVFAGHEPSAMTLVFALQELSYHPRIQEKLRREINSYREDVGGVLGFYDSRYLTYLDMVISETLRLHPPFSFMFRVCTEPYKVPGMDFTIQAGEQIVYSISGIQKDPSFWANCKEFAPNRFARRRAVEGNRYLPFGSGPRSCIGKRMAVLSIKSALVHLISSFNFTPCDDTQPRVMVNKGGFFECPKFGVRLMVEEL